MSAMNEPILSVRDLKVDFETNDGVVNAVKGVDLDVFPCETVAIVGESGSGKSQTTMAMMGLLATNGMARGSARYRGQELIGLPEKDLNRVRGEKITMIFQEPMTSLDPLYKIGRQIAEPLIHHGKLARRDIRPRIIELLELVGLPDPERRIDAYPHELSGGQRQRVMIAMALANDPDILIADEPTTALDVTIQAQILDLLVRLQKETDMGLILITHDMGVVAETAERVQVQYAGQKVEEQPVRDLFRDPHHPYTAALLAALPERAKERGHLPSIPGVVPGQSDRPPACLFEPRCSYATDLCRRTVERQGPALGLALCNYPLIGGKPRNHPGPMTEEMRREMA